MVESLSNKLSSYFVSINATNEEDQEMLAYGIFHLIAGLQQIIILVAISLVFQVLPQTIGFTIFFCSLKRYAGGTHANSHWACVLEFTTLVFVSVFLSTVFLVSLINYTILIFPITTCIIILIKAPIVHPNNPKSAKMLVKIRKKAIFVSLLQFVLIVVILIDGYNSLYQQQILLSCSIGGLASAITLLLPIPSKY